MLQELTISTLSLLSLTLLHVVSPLQDVFGADETGRQRREVYVSLHCPFYVGGCRTEKQDHGGKFQQDAKTCHYVSVKFVFSDLIINQYISALV